MPNAGNDRVLNLGAVPPGTTPGTVPSVELKQPIPASVFGLNLSQMRAYRFDPAAGTQGLGFVDPDNVAAAARELLRDYVRAAAGAQEPPRGRGPARALTLVDLRALSAACPDTLAGTRDRALALLDFAVASRRSEIAGLLVLDVAEDPNGLLVDVRVSKTSPRTVAVPYSSNPATCPVRAWRAWRDAAGLADDPAGPAFRRIDRHGRLLPSGLSGAAVRELLTRAAGRADVENITGHSARAGPPTEARRASNDRKAIAAITRHTENSASLNDYMHRAGRWDDENENALIGIGL